MLMQSPATQPSIPFQESQHSGKSKPPFRRKTAATCPRASRNTATVASDDGDRADARVGFRCSESAHGADYALVMGMRGAMARNTATR